MSLKLPIEKSSGEVDLSRIRMLIYGQPKIGKTTLCTGFPDSLFLATEPGYHAHKVYAMDIHNWQEFIDAAELILAGKHHFKTIVIDTVDILANYCVAHVCKKLNIDHISDAKWSRGYDSLKKELEGQLNPLFQSKYGVLLTSHTKTQELLKKDSSISKTVITLNNQARSIILPKVDTIGLIKMKTFKLAEGTHVEKRILSFKASEFEDSGDRLKRFPEEVILNSDPTKSYAEFTKYFRKEAGQKTVQQQRSEATAAREVAAAVAEEEDEQQATAKQKVAPIRKTMPIKGGSKTMKKT